MADLWFSLKMMIITGFLIIFMQIRIGNSTLEEHAMLIIKTNPGFTYINEVAEGGIIALRQIYRGVAGKISTRIGETMGTNNSPGNRNPVNLSRSKAVLESLAEKAREKSQSLRQEFRQDIQSGWNNTSNKSIKDSSYEEILYKEPVTLEE